MFNRSTLSPCARGRKLPVPFPKLRRGAVEAEHQEGIFIGVCDDRICLESCDGLRPKIEVDRAVVVHLDAFVIRRDREFRRVDERPALIAIGDDRPEVLHGRVSRYIDLIGLRARP